MSKIYIYIYIRINNKTKVLYHLSKYLLYIFWDNLISENFGKTASVDYIFLIYFVRGYSYFIRKIEYFAIRPLWYVGWVFTIFFFFPAKPLVDIFINPSCKKRY